MAKFKRNMNGGKNTSDDLVNEAIRFKEVLVIGPEGEQLGTMQRREALDKAYDMNMDLMCVAPGAKVPVCKILDYGKYRFESQKKAREAKKNQHVTEVKARDWIEEGQKVRIDMKFRGRMITRQEVGREVMNKFIEGISDIASVEKQPNMEGNTMSVVFAPKKK